MITNTAIKLAATYSYSSLQATLDTEDAKKVKNLAAGIADEDLYTESGTDKYGREETPHITICYGIHTEDADIVKAAAKNTGRLKANITGAISVFKSDDYDVLKLEVKSDDFSALNKKVRDSLAVTSSFDKYIPHVTLAYLKKGKGAKYIKLLKAEKMALSFDSLDFSSRNGSFKSVNLSKSGISKTGARFLRIPKIFRRQKPDEMTRIGRGIRNMMYAGVGIGTFGAGMAGAKYYNDYLENESGLRAIRKNNLISH